MNNVEETIKSFEPKDLTEESFVCINDMAYTINKIDEFNVLFKSIDFLSDDIEVKDTHKLLRLSSRLDKHLVKQWALYTKDFNPGYFNSICNSTNEQSLKTMNHIREMVKSSEKEPSSTLGL